jgi:hypothetical protein
MQANNYPYEQSSSSTLQRLHPQPHLARQLSLQDKGQQQLQHLAGGGSHSRSTGSAGHQDSLVSQTGTSRTLRDAVSSLTPSTLLHLPLHLLFVPRSTTAVYTAAGPATQYPSHTDKRLDWLGMPQLRKQHMES